MKAITITAPGGPEVLRWSDVPDPQPAAGEVLIEVAASAVNRADLLQRQGFYDPPPGASPYLGMECSGQIRSLGEGVAGWSVGDQVCALLSGGGYAERVAVPSGQVMALPRGVGVLAAAALPEVACTVWANVVLTAGLRQGDTLLVHGGSSGVGTMAIQVGKALGARVIVTAGTEAKVRRCRELGADAAVNYREEDFVARVAEETDDRGADVILDNMGAAYLVRNVAALATGGRLLVIGLQGGRRSELDLGVLLAKRASVTATSLRALPAVEKAAVVTAVVTSLWPLIESGRVRPVVDRMLPMYEAAAAHRVLEESTHVGKVLLTI